MKLPWCVEWRPSTPEEKALYPNGAWCAIEGKPDPDAIEDATICGQFVVMRIGPERRMPTCAECRTKLKTARRAA